MLGVGGCLGGGCLGGCLCGGCRPSSVAFEAVVSVDLDGALGHLVAYREHRRIRVVVLVLGLCLIFLLLSFSLLMNLTWELNTLF